jgi:hypothetical protein
MAYRNQNSRITQEIKAAAGLSELTGYPQQISESIIPVITVNKKYCDIVKVAVAAGTIYTTPANKNFYLCNVIAAQTTPDEIIEVTITIGGVAVKIIDLTIALASTAGSTCVLNLVYPVKIDRNTAITLTGAGTASATIIGYTEDVTGE